MKLRTLLLSLLSSLFIANASAQVDIGLLSTYYNSFKNYFTDATCSELLPEYAAMSDEEFSSEVRSYPPQLRNIALKVKNGSWAPREKEFRIADYAPHGSTYSWSAFLRTNQYSYLQHPTGITATAGDTLMVFVDKIPELSYVRLTSVQKNNAVPDYRVPEADITLKEGLNIILPPQEDVIMFMSFTVLTDTTSNSLRLDDVADLKVHIEGGDVNGYFDVRRHTDEDWRDMLANHFKHYSVQVKGEKVLFHMELDNIKRVCPNTITDAIGWWDDMVIRQHKLMGVTKYYDRWQSMMMARDGYEGAYMYATTYFTYYESETVSQILPWRVVYENPGQMWGPAHEIGHMNQAAINIVSCTEASNNLFSNVQVHEIGKTTTRGSGVSNCKQDFENKVAFPLRGDVIGKSRMFFQLYLYFHAAGKDTTFYPRLFEALRQDRLVKGYYTNAVEDQLKFAEKCCEVAEMDLSEFFEAWGFFVPMNQANVGDYGTYLVSLTEEEAAASKARMQKYSKKGGHLMFIEDRIKPSKRTDGVAGNRIDFGEDVAVGKMGETGQWEDYIDESVKAKGYFYKQTSGFVSIVKEQGAAGALGFKLYDSETGELLAFNNDYSLKIPVSAQGAKFRVVAAQADGTDYEIPNVAESDSEELQLEHLDAVLAVASKMMSIKTTTGREIGYFYSDALANLQNLYDNAKAAAENQDTSVHSYKEWAALLNAEIERLNSDLSARAYLKELDAYVLTNHKEKAYHLCYDEFGLKADKQNQTPVSSPNKRWMVESTGELHHYYIKNKNGLYINHFDANVGTSCSGSDKSSAIVIKANYHDAGRVYFTTEAADGSELYLTLNSDYKVVFTSELVDASLWQVLRVEANNTGIGAVEAEKAEQEIIFDLTGRRIEEITEPGIYIINGKKVLAK